MVYLVGWERHLASTNLESPLTRSTLDWGGMNGEKFDLLDVVGFVCWPHHHMVQAFLSMLCRQSNPEDLKNKYLSGPLLVSKRLSIKTPSILGSDLVSRHHKNSQKKISKKFQNFTPFFDTRTPENFTVAITFAIWTSFPSACSFSTAFRALSVLSDSGSKHFSPLI